MEATDSYSLDWKKNEVWLAHARILKMDPTRRYQVPIYHIGLTSYLRWALAALLPNPIDDTPIKLGHVDFEACVKDYGWPRPLSDVHGFLQDLLGEKFKAAFGFAAGVVDYQYLVDKVSAIIIDQQERGCPIPRGLTHAENWLNEQIALLKASTSTPISAATFIDERPLVDTASVKPIRLTLRQVALLHIYQGYIIHPKEANAIAKQYGYKSGPKLYDHFRKLVRPSQRIGVEEKMLAPMISDVTMVIAHLAGTARQQAENELQTLQAKE
jgi:hypothetical protein